MAAGPKYQEGAQGAYVGTAQPIYPGAGWSLWAGALYQVQQTFANPTASGNTQIVAAPGAGRKIVLLWTLVTNKAATDRSYNFQSAATAKTATHMAAANGGGANHVPQQGGVVAECNANEALNINLDAAGNLGVDVNYIDVPS